MAARKILLVDDSKTILQMEQMILANEPYELVIAHDGVEGVALALEINPDLILLDVVMPRMGGFEALRALRANQRTSAVPIVMVTTQAEADSIETGYASGCSDYMSSPSTVWNCSPKCTISSVTEPAHEHSISETTRRLEAFVAAEFSRRTCDSLSASRPIASLRPSLRRNDHFGFLCRGMLVGSDHQDRRSQSLSVTDL